MAGWLHFDVTLVRASLALLAVSGCFYVSPINQRPSADIMQDSSAPVARGEQFTLEAVTHDPEGQGVTVSWRIYTCTDATAPAGCDESPYFEKHDTTIQPIARAFRDDKVTPTLALRVILEAFDSQGATAMPDQELLIPLTDAPPTVQTSQPMCRYGCVVGTPIDFFATVADADDAAALVHVAWQVYPQPGATYTLTPIDPGGQRLVPSAVGNQWEIDVTATDPVGMAVTKPIPFQVVPDHPPCLESWAPSTPPAGQTLPLADPTLFQVLVVKDDLDPYPPVPGDSLLGSPTFSWTLLTPGATQRTKLGVIGNNVPLDPSSYNPGDVLELRVEIQDRTNTMVNCADSSPTCSVISDPTCIQRLTWTVQVQ